MEKPKQRDWLENSWIRSSMWSLVDQHASMRKEGTLSRREAQYLVRRSKDRAKQVGEVIMAALKEEDWREAWRILGAWHCAAGGFSTKPCYATMDK